MSVKRLQALDETAIREELRGYPEETVGAVLALRGQPESTALMQEVVLRVLNFYLPRGVELDLTEQEDTLRLREDLGIDSLTFSEAAFKLEDLFGVRIENAELAALKTLADVKAYVSKRFLG